MNAPVLSTTIALRFWMSSLVIWLNGFPGSLADWNTMTLRALSVLRALPLSRMRVRALACLIVKLVSLVVALPVVTPNVPARPISMPSLKPSPWKSPEARVMTETPVEPVARTPTVTETLDSATKRSFSASRITEPSIEAMRKTFVEDALVLAVLPAM